jgi:hypothetical protein
MGIAWGLSRYSPSFAERDRKYRGRGMTPIQAPVALARHACRLAYRLLTSQEPFDEERYCQGGTVADGDGHVSYAARRRTLACRPSALGRSHGEHESLPPDAA